MTTHSIPILYIVLHKDTKQYYTTIFDRQQALEYMATINTNYYGRKNEYILVEYIPTKILKREEPIDLEEIEKSYANDE